eukprot:COSAG05_NODE_1974_length_3765_cov_19.906983_3_plen_54_part_00
MQQMRLKRVKEEEGAYCRGFRILVYGTAVPGQIWVSPGLDGPDKRKFSVSIKN